MAKKLGFDDEEVADIVGEDDEDDYLGEIMRNAEIPEDGIIREFWHAQKWRKTMDLDILSPMYATGLKHYYVNEVCQLGDGSFVVPVRWVTFRGKIYADAFSVTFDSQNQEATIMDSKTTFICAENLADNYHDLKHAGKIPKWGALTEAAGYPARMPNPKRIIAAGRPIYSSLVNYFSDDVSGNRSKSWNKHWNAYMTHANLPRELHQQEFHVHFVSTSPNATVSEQFQEFKAAVEATHTKPVDVRDEFGNTSCFCIHVNAGASDNPMQSEVSSHIGGKGNCFCRKCRVGGTQKEKASNEGYHSLFEFKTITQTNVFHIRGLVSELKFKAWKAVGELSALLWVPEIRSPTEYQGDLKVAIGNVLDICAAIDPSKIVAKMKYHLLVHAPYDAAQFGPLIGVATEIFESFNGVFHYCSILSNHLAPSRDIVRQLGDQEGLKHRITGGWWSLDEGGEMVLQKLVGWTEKKLVKHGEVRLIPLKRGKTTREEIPLKSTSAGRALNFGLYNPDSMWKKCLHVISESLDECFIDSWVFAKSLTPDNSKFIGRISDILVDTAGVVLVVLERFQVLGEHDELYGMPALVRRDGEVTFLIVPAKSVMFKFNVQDDCDSAGCEATGIRLRMQERVESDQTESFVIHKSLDRFIINTHAFHNAHLLRATLPRNLVAPIPLHPDREAIHHELASQLRQQLVTRKRKRAQQDDDDEGSQPRKKAKKAKRGSRRTSGQNPQEYLASGRAKRQIKPTEKARATPGPDGDKVDSEEESDSSDMAYDYDSDDDLPN
ncbi:hypothetical protein MSAN_01593300 [Mycena sanguinolenta]|uniref:Uncharacterized protein n=1 Tax=Mycena sanguinolenta TaxID=230812 RepID=A0A8H6Y1M4_9AGAR|nr:hypothetical protein MSAN_01593300 [Mycena sanguinolenta]